MSLASSHVFKHRCKRVRGNQISLDINLDCDIGWVPHGTTNKGCWSWPQDLVILLCIVFNIAHAAISSAHTYMSLIIYALKVRAACWAAKQKDKQSVLRVRESSFERAHQSKKTQKGRINKGFHESGYHCKKIGTSCVRWTGRRPWAVGRRVV